MNTAFRLTVRRTDLSAYSPPLGSAVERKRVGLNRFPDGHGYERCLLAPRFRRGSNTHSGCWEEALLDIETEEDDPFAEPPALPA
jgi:hypothetical protein